MPTLAVFQLYHGILSVLGVTTVSKFIKNNQAFHSIFGHMTFQVKHEISLDKKKNPSIWWIIIGQKKPTNNCMTTNQN